MMFDGYQHVSADVIPIIRYHPVSSNIKIIIHLLLDLANVTLESKYRPLSWSSYALPCLAKDSDEHVQQGDTGENHKKREEPKQSNALLAKVANSVLRMVISCAFVNTREPK